MNDELKYFQSEWKTTEIDDYVVEKVKKANHILDVGCGYNQYKQFNNNLYGIDIVNPAADLMIDILDYTSPKKYDLIICYGVLHFYNLQWIDDRFKKVVSLLDNKATILMKVNPGFPNEDGTTLPWYSKWTLNLAEHFAEVYNLEIENNREWTRGRIKWDYVKK